MTNPEAYQMGFDYKPQEALYHSEFVGDRFEDSRFLREAKGYHQLNTPALAEEYLRRNTYSPIETFKQ